MVTLAKQIVTHLPAPVSRDHQVRTFLARRKPGWGRKCRASHGSLLLTGSLVFKSQEAG